MDALELLKKQWQVGEDDLPRFSADDIYKMLLKKSTSIVKWIFFISIGEILLWTGLGLLIPDSSHQLTDDLGLHDVMLTANILYYLIFLTFIIIFYRNYRAISVTDSVKDLLRNILRTRKTVKYFIIYNVVGACIMMIGINIFYYLNQDLLFQLLNENKRMAPHLDKEQFLKIFFITQMVLAVLIIGGILLFYRVIYGILLRRLHTNYKELEKIEV